jgi:hypothetical protein
MASLDSRSLLVFLFGVSSLAGAACGASPEAKSSSATECSAQAKPASDKVRAVIEANLACTADGDCMDIAVSSACFDQCSIAIAKSGQAAVEKALSDVSANECKAFTDAGCKVIIPPCAPPSPPACREGKCI